MRPTHRPVPEDLETDEAPLELDEFLPYRLSVVTNLVSKAFARRYDQAFGLTTPEWRVMAVLGRYAPASSQEVCHRTAMDKAKVSRAVTRLVASGLVLRRGNPLDQRQNMLALSRRGRAVYQQIVPQAHAMEHALKEGLAPEEVEQLDQLLRKLQDRAMAMMPAGPVDGID